MTPGTHATARTIGDTLDARSRGLQARDTILILMPGPTSIAVHLMRQPPEGSVAASVLKHGFGGLNIDACRVHSGPSDGGNSSGGSAFGQNSGWNAHNNRTTRIDRAMPAGRWPTNILLVHGPKCIRAGTLNVPAHGAFNKPGDSKGGILNKTGKARRNPHPGYASLEGTETVEAWDCQLDCPVRLLDEQSFERGIHPTGTTTRTTGSIACKGYSRTTFGVECRLPGDSAEYYNDRGGASRFFPQFACLEDALDWIQTLTGNA